MLLCTAKIKIIYAPLEPKTLFLAKGLERLDHRVIISILVNLAKRDSPNEKQRPGGRACRDPVQGMQFLDSTQHHWRSISFLATAE